MKNEIIQWDYKKSVEKVKSLHYKWCNMTDEIVKELWLARENLSRERVSVTNGTLTWKQYLIDCDIQRSTAHRWLDKYDPNTEKLIEDKSKAHVGHNTGFYEWYTPPDIIESARECMGSIDIDPASSKEANKTVKADKIYTEKENGIDKEWSGNVWMNPPYKNELIKQFAEKLNNEYESGNIKSACAIVNNATETEWFHLMIKNVSAICFPKGRVRFYDVSQQHESAPLQGQAILYYGKDINSFYKSFSKHGFIVGVIHE